MSLPEVSIVIVTFNGCADVRRCLASILEQTTGVAFEVVVLDNASSDGTPAMIAQEFPDVRLIRRQTNSGFAAGVNEGIRASGAEFVFVLNPDCVMTQNILPGMISFLRADRSIGLLAPMLRDASGELQLSCRAFPNYGTAIFNRYSLATKLFPGNPASRRYLMTDSSHDEIRDVDWASGAAWLVPRPTFERAGLLDEAFFWSIEDVDFCQRVHRAGLRVVYYPKAQLVHGIGGSTRYAPSRAIIARHRGMWRYYQKYLGPRGRVWRAIAGTTVATGIAGRCAAQLVASAVRSVAGQSRSEISTGT